MQVIGCGLVCVIVDVPGSGANPDEIFTTVAFPASQTSTPHEVCTCLGGHRLSSSTEMVANNRCILATGTGQLHLKFAELTN